MAKGLIHGESGDTLQMESAFLIKLLSRFSRFELFYLVRWKRAFPLVFRAALAALVCDAESTVLPEKAAIWRTMESVPDTARWLWGTPLPGDRAVPRGELCRHQAGHVRPALR